MFKLFLSKKIGKMTKNAENKHIRYDMLAIIIGIVIVLCHCKPGPKQQRSIGLFGRF